MPIHDWTRVSSGIYHGFHQDWTIEICRTLNRGILPPGYYAMADQRVSGPEPDVLAVQLPSPQGSRGLAVAEVPPKLRPAAPPFDPEAAIYASKANRIAIHHEIGRVVAIIEVVSPGNKDSRSATAAFVGKAIEFLRAGVHLLVIDPFPPGPRDPQGLAQVIWESLSDDLLAARPIDKPLTVAAIDAGPPLIPYVEPLAVGDPWPESPLFLAPGWYVNVPIEATYQASWEAMPRPIQDLLSVG